MRIRWPRRFSGLPLHPMLVHFPLIFWLSTPVLDLLALWSGPQPWWDMGLVVSTAGVAIGAFAVMTGLLDYIELSDTGSNDVRLAARHGVRTSIVWCAMTIKLIIAGFSAASRTLLWGTLVLDLLASALLLQGALFGTRIVYGGSHTAIRSRSKPPSAD